MPGQQNCNPYIRVKRSSIHKKGVFAKVPISKGTRVIEYVGEKITKAESDRRAGTYLLGNPDKRKHGIVYIFELNKRYDIDGDVPYNTARYINHSCDPNGEVEIIRGRIWIIAVRDIAPGEELTYNYGYSFEDYKEHPCYCQASSCIGYILAEEHWPRLKRSCAS